MKGNFMNAKELKPFYNVGDQEILFWIFLILSDGLKTIWLK